MKTQILGALCGIVLLISGCGGSSGGGSDAFSSGISARANAGQGDLNGGSGGPRGPVGPGTGSPVPFPPGGGDPNTVFDYVLFATESPGAPENQIVANWGGVLGLFAEGLGLPLESTEALGPDQLSDPAGIAYSSDLDQIMVANRHGNVRLNNDGSTGVIGGSLSRFLFSSTTGALTPTPGADDIITEGPAHQLNFNPVTGEMFVAMVGPDFSFTGGVEKYSFDTAGNATLEDTIASGSTCRGVVCSEDGTHLYVTFASSDIAIYDLSNTATPELTVQVTEAGANPNLHYMAIRDGELYVAALGGNAILRYQILEPSNHLQIPPEIIPANSVTSVAFSPDGLEMFAAGHDTSDQLLRFTYDANNDAWIPGTSLATTSLGGLLAMPLTTTGP